MKNQDFSVAVIPSFPAAPGTFPLVSPAGVLLELENRMHTVCAVPAGSGCSSLACMANTYSFNCGVSFQFFGDVTLPLVLIQF